MMGVLFAVASAVFPIFLVAGTAYGIRKRLHLDTKTLALLNTYFLLPALVLSGLSKTEISWELFGLFALAGVLIVIITGSALWVAAKAMHLSRGLENACLMTTFTNLGNFGIPVVTFAFADDPMALPYAVLIMTVGGALQNNVGLFLALRAHHASWRAMLRVFNFPVLYALILALLLQRTGTSLPAIVSDAVDMVAGATIPMQLVIVGAKLAETHFERSRTVMVVSAIRLIFGPVAALLAVWLVGLDGLPARVFILQHSGPIAVGMAVFGVQFDVQPRFLSSAVSLTFILSFFTVGVVLAVIYLL